MSGLLDLDPRVVATARRLAARAAEPVISLARAHTTVSVERATLRLAGITGADAAHRAGDVPWVNRVVDAVREQCGLEHGAALPVFHAVREHDLASLTELAEATAAGQVRYTIRAGGTRPARCRPRGWRSRGGSAPSTGTGRSGRSWWRGWAIRRSGHGCT